MATALITNPQHSAHDELHHVETAARLRAVHTAIDSSGLRAGLCLLPADPASEQQILAVHHPSVLRAVQYASAQLQWLDQDTYTTSGSYDAACSAAGAAIRAVSAVLSGEVTNAFAITRPPGHHATATRSMGFCLFNNIAIAARHAFDMFGISRIAIVDYDVHHGNGTQAIFSAERQVCFCSTHAAMLYPGTGAEHEVGAGTILNVPLPHNTGDQGFAALYDAVVLPALRQFQPELILVSAGYDAHWADPLGTLALSTNGYAALTRRLLEVATDNCRGRIVLVLEGGYNLEALAACVVASLHVLLGHDPGSDRLGAYTGREPDISGLIERVRHRHPLLQH